MVTGSSKDDNPLPFGSSHWDKLPNEIKDTVFSFHTPLWLFLGGRLKPKSNVDKKTILSIWLDAFDIDWQGDLSLLPGKLYEPRLNFFGITRIKSRSMYDRMCRLFPSAAETNPEFADTDKHIDVIVRAELPYYEYSTTTHRSYPFRLLHVPMRHMWLDLLGNSLDELPYARANDCIVHGHTDLLRHLVDTGRVDLRRIDEVCVDEPDNPSYNVLDVAAEQGHLDILKMLHIAGHHTASTDAMDRAASNGHFDVVKWLHENRTEGCTTGAMDSAAGGGHLDVVKWLHDNRFECTKNAINWAARFDHVDVVKWLHENCNEGCTTHAIDWAAENGYLDIVRFLLGNRSEGFSDNTIKYCQSTEISEILVISLSVERKRQILEKMISVRRPGPGVDALRKSLEDYDGQGDKSIS